MADGPKPPKGWLMTGVVFLLLSLAGCGGGAIGCGAFVNDLQKAVEQGGETPLGESTTFTASGSKAAILATAPSARCEGIDGNGNRIPFETPGSGTTGNVTNNGEQFDLSYLFDTDNNQSYTLTCSSEFGTGSYLVVPFPGFTTIVAGISGIAAGVLFFMIGIICVIVGLVKRSGWKKRNGPAAASSSVPGAPVPPPPGGYQPGGYQPGAVPPAPGQVPPAPGQVPPAPGQVPPAPGQVPPPPAGPPQAPPPPPLS